MTACNSNQVDLCFVRGDSGRLDVRVRTKDGEAYDLSGATLFLTVKNALTDGDSAATIRKEVTSHDDAEGGLSHFAIAPGDNATSGTRFYDVQLKTSDGDIATLYGGVWRVLADVTIRTAPLA
jgi:hypothetical protein